MPRVCRLSPQTNAQNFRNVKVISYGYIGQSEGVRTFFCSSLDFGRKTDVMTVKESTYPPFAQ